jgi:hypothetical protein
LKKKLLPVRDIDKSQNGKLHEKERTGAAVPDRMKIGSIKVALA